MDPGFLLVGLRDIDPRSIVAAIVGLDPDAGPAGRRKLTELDDTGRVRIVNYRVLHETPL
ncbi:hypothetical protein GCM10023171_00090 [Microbacterium panaciterrae]|uniref:Uncharacterized protein n=1 Tax=Microbacterium panaciterrae TaxID=985759 RepID=A0ABP8P0Y5_9MICO